MDTTTAAVTAHHPYRSALRNRDFRRLFTAMAVWETGAWSYTVVITAYVFTQNGSATAVAWLVTSRWITGFLLAPYAGVLADRYDRRKLMIWCAGLSALAMVAMAGVVAAGLPLWILVALSIVNALLESPNRPASGAMVPEMVEERDLPTANALLNLLENVVIAVGPAIGGLLVVVADPVVGVMLNATTYAIAVLILLRVSLSSRGDAERGESSLRQMVDGVGTLLQTRVALGASLATLLCSGIYGASVVLLLPLTVEIGAGEGGYGYLLTASAIGSILGAPVAGRLSRVRRLDLVIVVMLVVEAVPFALMILTDQLLVVAVLMAVSGAAMTVVDVIALTLVQREIPDGLLGRALATFDAFALAGIAGAGITGALVLDRFGMEAALWSIAIGFSVLAVLMCVPTLRGARLLSEDEQERLDLVERVDLFRGVGQAALEHLASRATPVTIRPGTVLMAEGDPSDDLWLLESGALDVSAGGRTLPTVEAPGYVGEIGLLHGLPRTATVIAAADGVVLRVPGDDFLAALGAGEPSESMVRLADERIRRTR